MVTKHLASLQFAVDGPAVERMERPRHRPGSVHGVGRILRN